MEGSFPFFTLFIPSASAINSGMLDFIFGRGGGPGTEAGHPDRQIAPVDVKSMFAQPMSCGKCGTRPELMHLHDTKASEVLIWVECGRCGTRCDSRHTSTDAIAEWNKKRG